MNHKVVLIVGGLVIALVGVGGGILLAKRQAQVAGATYNPDAVRTATEVGVKDDKTYRDAATGTIEEGGLNGEGTHKLVRDGGPSQTVYLLSSVVDLAEFVGKKVEVKGETIKAQKAPWLMDVGLVKLLE